MIRETTSHQFIIGPDPVSYTHLAFWSEGSAIKQGIAFHIGCQQTAFLTAADRKAVNWSLEEIPENMKTDGRIQVAAGKCDQRQKQDVYKRQPFCSGLKTM